MSAIFGGSGTKNKARLDLYVSDVNGNDANSGLTPASPVKTLAGAIAKITFNVVAFDVVIHVGRHAGAGYTWATLDSYYLVDGASMYVYGDGAGQAGEDGFTVLKATGPSLAGTTTAVVKDAAMVVNTYRGKTIEILSGAAIGNRRTINYNTGTDIVPTVQFSAGIVAGDTYRIIDSAVVVNTPAFPGTTLIARGVGSPRKSFQFLGGGGFVYPAPSGLCIVNISGIDNLDFCENTAVFFFGGSFSGNINDWMSNCEVGYGETNPNLAQLPALIASTTAWLGWTPGGLTTNSVSWEGGGNYYHGFIVAARLQVSGINHGAIHGGDLSGTAGFASISVNSADVFGDCVLEIGDGRSDTMSNPLRVTALGVGGGFSVASCVYVTGPRSCVEFTFVRLASAIVVLTSATVLLAAKDGGQISTQHGSDLGIELHAGTFGCLAISGGAIGLSHDFILAFGTNPSPSGDITFNLLNGRPAGALTVTTSEAYMSADGSRVWRE